MSSDFIELSVSKQQFISPEQAFHYQIIPKEIETDLLHFYIDELHYSPHISDELELIFGIPVRLEKSNSDKLQRSLSRYYRRQKGNQPTEIKISDEQDFLIALIWEAHHLGSSDIHLEPLDPSPRVRIRIDGKLMNRFEIPNGDYPAMVNKIKIRAHLDIAEKRLPQDGRIEFNEGALKFDIRVSILPTLHGEKVVMRLLSRNASQLDLSKIGLSEEDLSIYNEAIQKPHGIILISGPTGSGKTTTLYATLKQLNEEARNIVTIEDPIEYTLDGINQVQLKEAIGLNFPTAMKTFLRQDPDVIMLGEIRDTDTAHMAIRASLTGHLVFSTIHTNSAWGTISRLIDMDVPPFLIANTLNISVAQRLVRLICQDCCTDEKLELRELPQGFIPPRKIEFIKAPHGCEKCYYSGYSGRKAIYEILKIDKSLAEAIKQNTSDINPFLKSRNIQTLSDKAFDLLAAGKTSLAEVFPLLMQ